LWVFFWFSALIEGISRALERLAKELPVMFAVSSPWDGVKSLAFFIGFNFAGSSDYIDDLALDLDSDWDWDSLEGSFF